MRAFWRQSYARTYVDIRRVTCGKPTYIHDTWLVSVVARKLSNSWKLIPLPPPIFWTLPSDFSSVALDTYSRKRDKNEEQYQGASKSFLALILYRHSRPKHKKENKNFTSGYNWMFWYMVILLTEALNFYCGIQGHDTLWYGPGLVRLSYRQRIYFVACFVTMGYDGGPH